MDAISPDLWIPVSGLVAVVSTLATRAWKSALVKSYRKNAEDLESQVVAANETIADLRERNAKLTAENKALRGEG